MTPRLASVLNAQDLPPAELSAARLDGEVYALGDAWCPVDHIESAEARAAAAAILVPSRAIAERLTAAWIFGAAPLPARHQFCVDVGARAHLAPSARLQLREVRCGSGDTVVLGALRVTTPLRTALDLARTGADDCIPVLAGLLIRAGVHPDDPVERLVPDSRAPHTILALRRLRAGQQLRRSPRGAVTVL